MMPWLLLFTLALPDTITVDGSGGGDFTTIQEAIDAASPGDLIRVLPGVYPGFDLDKPLSILGLTGAPAPQIKNIVRVTGTGPVCLAGLALRTLQLNDIVGLAVVDDCTLGKWNRSILPAALQIRQCTAVLIGRCNILGQFGIDAGPTDGGPAVDVQESRVTITDSVMEGGWGTDDFESGGDGGAGVRATLGSWVELAGSSVKGGDEGAKIRASLLARAASLRRKELADVEGKAGERSQSMLVAQLVMIAAFFLFLGFPAGAAILGS